MGTETRHFCDRCGNKTQFRCQYLRIRSDNGHYHHSIGELCNDCIENLKIKLRDWMENHGE